jgi:hypothetical protein
MNSNQSETAAGREVVALFADRESFEAAVEALLAAGFERSDLSVLASHQSIDAAGSAGRDWHQVLPALVGELKYEVPLVASGAVLLVGGSLAATIAGIVGAGVGGMAVKELIDEVTSTPHSDEFARAVEAGSVILWVRAADGDAEARASDVLRQAGGANIHAIDAATAT